MRQPCLGDTIIPPGWSDQFSGIKPKNHAAIDFLLKNRPFDQRNNLSL